MVFIKPNRFKNDVNPETNRISKEVVDAAFKVHYALGPGLLENVYETCLIHKLLQKNLNVKNQVTLPIIFEDITLDAGLRLDLLVEDKLIVEIKAVETLLPVHHAQLLTYLKLSGYELGLLMNFNVPIMKNGIKRIALSNQQK